MKPLFFIDIPPHFHSDESVYNWYKKDSAVESSGCDSLAQIKQLSFDCDVIAVFPSFNVSRRQVNSKLRNRKKLDLAIAYQLEEILSEEIESLFFAYQQGKEKDSFDVAIVNKVWFEKWLEIFQQQEIMLNAVISDAMLLEVLEQDYLLIKKTDYFLLKTPTEIHPIDNDNIYFFLQQLKPSLPDELIFINAGSAFTLADSAVKLKLIPLQDSLLKLLTTDFNLKNCVNLLQGAYQPKLKNDWRKIIWLSAGLFLALFVAVAFQAYQHWQLSRQEAQLDQQRLAIFKKNFPNTKRIVNPLAQMKNELESLKQSQNEKSQFISLAAKTATALKEMLSAQTISLLGMEFDGAVLVIKVNAESFALVEKIKQTLTQQQLNVEITATEKVESRVNVSLKLSGL
jgi:general secretion pathway protein L